MVSMVEKLDIANLLVFGGEATDPVVLSKPAFVFRRGKPGEFKLMSLPTLRYLLLKNLIIFFKEIPLVK